MALIKVLLHPPENQIKKVAGIWKQQWAVGGSVKCDGCCQEWQEMRLKWTRKDWCSGKEIHSPLAQGGSLKDAPEPQAHSLQALPLPLGQGCKLKLVGIRPKPIRQSWSPRGRDK